jgi:hypothetical protein
VIFGTGLGVLTWHYAEKDYGRLVIDDHSPALKNITRAEYDDMNHKLSRRLNRRKLLTLPIALAILLGTLSLIPRSGSYHDLFILGWAILVSLLVIGWMVVMSRQTKADCYKFGAPYPKRNRPLFSAFFTIQIGRCSNCGYQLFAGTEKSAPK